MEKVLREAALRSTRSIVDLLTRIVLFLIIFAPFIYFKFPQIEKFLRADIFFTTTGFYIPDLLSDSVVISLKLIFCSLAISAYFGFAISLSGVFNQKFHWLPALFVITSTIPIFITAYYLPYILFFVFILIILLSLSSLSRKVSIAFIILTVLLILISLAYINNTGYIDIIKQSGSLYLPVWIQRNLGFSSRVSVYFTENIMPWLGLFLIGPLFLIYYKKYPHNKSLITTLFGGALLIFGIIIYGYRTKVEGTYLLAPILTLSIGNLVLGLFINQIREGISEELQRDYIVAAVAKGASLWNHLKRKVLLIMLNTLKSQFALLLSLGVVVEKIYNLEGIGYLAWEYATQEADFITVAWIVVLCFILVWVFNILIDISTFAFSPEK